VETVQQLGIEAAGVKQFGQRAPGLVFLAQDAVAQTR
jgi:hypothetical protein